MPEDTPPAFVDAGALPPEADEFDVVDQSPILDTTPDADTIETAPEDQS